jgi:polyhydroxyalkanoate synthesis regulator protein
MATAAITTYDDLSDEVRRLVNFDDQDKNSEEGKTHCIFINLTYVQTSSLTV